MKKKYIKLVRSITYNSISTFLLIYSVISLSILQTDQKFFIEVEIESEYREGFSEQEPLLDYPIQLISFVNVFYLHLINLYQSFKYKFLRYTKKLSQNLYYQRSSRAPPFLLL